MDIQFWIWLIIVVVTVLARALKQKPKPTPPSAPREQQSWEEEKPSSRPLTFEELLREIQSAKEQRRPEPEPKRPAYRPGPQPQKPIYKEIDYDDDLGEEEQDLETAPAANDDRHSMDVYEKAKQEAFHRPSLEETMKLEDTEVRFGQFKGYESTPEKAPIADFLAELKDPNGFKKAFIMSEILTRKF